jgi:hypothetical protein
MILQVLEFEPPRRLVTRIANTDLPFGGQWTYELTPDGGGTRVRITEDGEIHNPAFRYMSRVFGQWATVEAYLRALGTKMGERATIDP